MTDRRQVAECVDQAAHELRDDRLDAGLGRDLGDERVPGVELAEGLRQQLSIGRGPAERGEASDGVGCRGGRRDLVGAGYAPSPSASL